MHQVREDDLCLKKFRLTNEFLAKNEKQQQENNETWKICIWEDESVGLTILSISNLDKFLNFRDFV